MKEILNEVYLEVSWVRKHDGAILSVDDMMVHNDRRLEIEKTSYLSQWTLKIRWVKVNVKSIIGVPVSDV